jgi:hypothetical protein
VIALAIVISRCQVLFARPSSCKCRAKAQTLIAGQESILFKLIHSLQQSHFAKQIILIICLLLDNMKTNQLRFSKFLFHLIEVSVVIDFAREKKMFLTSFAHRKYGLWISCGLSL